MSQKAIYSDFSGGLSDGDRNAQPNQYYAGKDIDLYKNWGYLTPGWPLTEITINSPGLIGNVIEIVYDRTSKYNYIVEETTGRIYLINYPSIVPTNTPLGNGTNYVTISSFLSTVKGTIAYMSDTTGGQTAGYYAIFNWKTDTGGGTGAGGIAIGKVGTNNWGNIAAVNFIPGFRTGLSQNGKADIIIWQTFVIYTNGEYIGRMDNSANPTVFTDQFIDLGSSWTSQLLFNTNNNYLGIVASNNEGEWKIFIYDLGTNLIQVIPLLGITNITSVTNNQGNIILTGNNGFESVSMLLTDTGIQKLNNLQHDINGILIDVGSSLQNAVSFYKNGILLGTSRFIFGYGSRNGNSNPILSTPASIPVNPNTSNPTIYSLKQTPGANSDYLVGYFNGIDNFYHVGYYQISGSLINKAVSVWKGVYSDLGQKCVLNYIKVYFKKLVSNDIATLSIDSNYGTANAIQQDGGVISFVLDGATTFKKFDLGQIECDNFRPVINWSSSGGGPQISKIVIDYDFLND